MTGLLCHTALMHINVLTSGMYRKLIFSYQICKQWFECSVILLSNALTLRGFVRINARHNWDGLGECSPFKSSIIHVLICMQKSVYNWWPLNVKVKTISRIECRDTEITRWLVFSKACPWFNIFRPQMKNPMLMNY